MGYSSMRSSRGRIKEERPWKIHPVWRGIGCALLIIIPVLSWAGADLFIDNVKNFPMPKELVGGVVIPTTDNAQVNSLINPINQLFRGITYGHFFFTAVFIFIGFGVLSVVYGFLYSAVGPPRYSRFDARPIKATRRRR